MESKTQILKKENKKGQRDLTIQLNSEKDGSDVIILDKIDSEDVKTPFEFTTNPR